MTDELNERRRGYAIGEFREKLRDLCDAQAGVTYYEDIVGVLFMEAFRQAAEGFEVEGEDD